MASVTPNYSFYLPGVNDPADQNIWGNQLNDNFSNLDTDLKAVSDVANANTPDVGDLKATARSTAPALWLFCNGAAVSRSTYSALFAAIGTTYGSGDGSTTFNIPDAGGRTLVGKEATATRLTAAISGVDGATLGASGGDQRMQTHTHTATQAPHSHTFGFANITGFSASGGSNGFVNTNTTTTSSATPAITVADAGTGSSQNVQPTLVINWLIYTGV